MSQDAMTEARKLFEAGLALMAQEDFSQAEIRFRQAHEIAPDRVSVLTNLSAALLKQLKFDEAEGFAWKSVELDEANAQGWLNLGMCHENAGGNGKALDCYEKSLAIDSAYGEAWAKYGKMLGAAGNPEQALTSLEKALSITPRSLEALMAYATVLSTLARHEEALKAYQAAYSINPSIPYLSGHILHTKMQVCDWDDLDTLINRIVLGVEKAEKTCTPLELIPVTASIELQRKCGEILSADYPAADAVHVRRAGGRKIRLGYFSSDFRNHAVSFLTAGLFEMHDRNNFEVLGFNLGRPTQDEMSQRLSRAFGRQVDLSQLDVRQSLERVGLEEIDIAIDLNGYTTGLRTELFSNRVAPVQINYLGFPATMGARFMDYIIGDEVLIPESMRKGFAEKIAYLPDCFQVNDARRPALLPMHRRDAGLSDEKFVFCSFCNSYKITPEIFSIWLRLLASVEDSVLWLLKKSEAQARKLMRLANEKGISSDRLIFANVLPYDRHLSRYQLADLALDTSPFGGGATSSDGLWAGVPVVTCLGETFAGRMSASLLNAVGLPELVTNSHEEYEAMAHELATHPDRLAAIKERLVQNRLTYPLFDTMRFTRNIETAYTMMWERYQAGLNPEHLHVPQK
jgi:predicted O-linked N-acetylglucosamine transferase (SPINDLY family)